MSRMLRFGLAPKAGALPDCATPRWREYNGIGPLGRNRENGNRKTGPAPTPGDRRRRAAGQGRVSEVHTRTRPVRLQRTRASHKDWPPVVVGTSEATLVADSTPSFLPTGSACARGVVPPHGDVGSVLAPIRLVGTEDQRNELRCSAWWEYDRLVPTAPARGENEIHTRLHPKMRDVGPNPNDRRIDPRGGNPHAMYGTPAPDIAARDGTQFS